MTLEYEFRSRIIAESSDKHNHEYRQVEKICNEWAAEGFIVFSIQQINDPDRYDKIMVRISAKRHRETAVTPKMKFEDEPT